MFDRFYGFLQGWINLSLEGILPGSNILYLMLVDEMAKSLELKSDEELKVMKLILTNSSNSSLLLAEIIEVF